MRTSSLRTLVCGGLPIVFIAIACSTDGGLQIGGETAGASSGAAPSAGSSSAGVPSSGGGAPSAGAPSSGAGAPVFGGSAGSGQGGGAAGGVASGGMSSAGRGGATSAGATSTAGASGCTQNLKCELSAPPSTGDIYQDCVNRINQFRAECACLPPLQRWPEGEACANQHAEYDSTRAAHSGFSANICTNGGSAQNECPGWRSTTEVIEGCLQSMWDEGPPPQNPCNDACFQTYGHFINMTNTRYTKVACGFFQTTAGRFWAVQNFSR